MIKINLLGEEAVSDNSNNFLIAGYAASFVVSGIFFFYLYTSTISENETLAARKVALQGELTTLKETTKEVRELEKRREDLRQKLTVIALLYKNKSGPVRVMDGLNSAIPERAWVSEATEKGGLMRITGMALDNLTISNFIKQLETSEFYPKVDMIESKSTQFKGTVIKEYLLQAKINYSGKLPDTIVVSSSGNDTTSGAAPSSASVTGDNAAKPADSTITPTKS